MVNDFATRVIVGSIVVVGAAAVVFAWVAGVHAFVGVVAGGSVAVGNFTCLARGARTVGESGLSAGYRGRWLLILMVRYAVTLCVMAMLLATGWADPVAFAAGISVLPLMLTVQGFRAARA